MVIIELKQHGDFDVEVTHSVWYSDFYSTRSEVPLSDDMFADDRDVQHAINELRKIGFRNAKTVAVTVGGNL